MSSAEEYDLFSCESESVMDSSGHVDDETGWETEGETEGETKGETRGTTLTRWDGTRTVIVGVVRDVRESKTILKRKKNTKTFALPTSLSETQAADLVRYLNGDRDLRTTKDIASLVDLAEIMGIESLLVLCADRFLDDEEERRDEGYAVPPWTYDLASQAAVELRKFWVTESGTAGNDSTNRADSSSSATMSEFAWASVTGSGA